MHVSFPVIQQQAVRLHPDVVEDGFEASKVSAMKDLRKRV